ncbi:MAG: hypothetical protein ACI843_002871 [Psychrobacter glaciei]|jgi:hypothetical protein
MEISDYQIFVEDLESRLHRLQNEYIHSQDPNALLLGPLLALTMLVKQGSLEFAQDRYSSMMGGPQWKIADDHLLDLRAEVEFMLAGPLVYNKRKTA